MNSAEPIATAAAPLRRPMRRAQTHIEAVRNRGLRHGLDFGLCDENDAFQKNDVNRALGPDGHSL